MPLATNNPTPEHAMGRSRRSKRSAEDTENSKTSDLQSFFSVEGQTSIHNIRGGTPELKGSRYALLKNEQNRTQKQNEIFQVIQKANLQVSLAWRLREEFKGIFECTSFAEAKNYLELWLASVQETAVQEVIQVAEMFQKHFDGVCNALCHQHSNARACNGKIQEVKTIGRGYRRFENFRVAILFSAED